MFKSGKIRNKIAAAVITFMVLGLLIFAGPANALTLSLGTPSESSVDKGSSVSFTATINLGSTDVYVPLANFTLSLSGTTPETCLFDLQGNVLSGCDGITITPLSISSSGYGYGEGSADGNTFGYGYGYGYASGTSNVWSYNITIDTTDYDTGSYTASLSSLVGSATYTSSDISFGVTDDTTVYANNETLEVGAGTTEIIIPAGSPIEDITINSSSSSSTDINLDLSSLINSTGSVELVNPLTLTRESTGSTAYTAELLAGTIITGGSSWGGEFLVPTVKTSSDFSAPSGSADVVIDMGSTTELNFSKAVKITLEGMAGKNAAWTRGTALTQITTLCDSTTAPTNINADSPRECYIDSGSDLVIFTYHFTKFAAYTPSSGAYVGGGSTSASQQSPAAATVANTLVKPIISVPMFGIITKIVIGGQQSGSSLTGYVIDSQSSKELTVSVSLLNASSLGSVSIPITYTIKDASGAIAQQETEFVNVTTQTSLTKKIDISSLKPGKYTLTTSAVYDNQKAPAVSEEAFEIANPGSNNLLWVIVALIAVVLLIIVGNLIRSRNQKSRKTELKAVN